MSKSNGCLGTILWSVITIIFLLIFFVTLSLRQPIGHKIAEITVCQPGTVQTSGAKTICLSQKTGQKIDVKAIEIFGFCPALLILIFFIFFAVVARIISKKSKVL
jgi:hypothetical protein